MVKSKKFLDLLMFEYSNLTWDIGYGGYDENDIEFFICRNIDKDGNIVDIEVRYNAIIVNVNMHEIYRTDDNESKYAAYIFNRLAANNCRNLNDYDLDGFMWNLLFEPNCCDCKYQNDYEACGEPYQTLGADHRKRRGGTAPNRALRDIKSRHRKQRGRTAPNGCSNCNLCNK